MFEVGRLYKRAELHARYGGQKQGGISTPKGQPFLLLFTGGGETYGYQDGWEPSGVFLYSGEGQDGDMTFTGGNRALRDHVGNGKDLHLFAKKGKMVRYLGLFACTSWSYRTAKDKAGHDRRAILFHLVPAEGTPPTGTSPAASPHDDAPAARVPLLDALRQKALASAASGGEANPKDAKRCYYDRSEAVRMYVLCRANGTCEVCGQPAPFRRLDGSPYLEPHHTRRIADSGPDHPRWVGGVCPNCHRHIHYGSDGAGLNQTLEAYLGTVEASRGT